MLITIYPVLVSLCTSECPPDWLCDWLCDWLSDLLSDWLSDWLFGWLSGMHRFLAGHLNIVQQPTPMQVSFWSGTPLVIRASVMGSGVLSAQWHAQYYPSTDQLADMSIAQLGEVTMEAQNETFIQTRLTVKSIPPSITFVTVFCRFQTSPSGVYRNTDLVDISSKS